MKTIVLGAGVVGTSTAYFLAKQGHEVEVVDRRDGAALETSFGNGGVLHASEVEPWSQPGMPRKILKWLGQEDAPLLVRYGAIPKMWRWGLAFIANCTPERSKRNAQTNLRIALHSMEVVKEVRAEIVVDYDMRTNGLIKIYASSELFDGSRKSMEALRQYGLPSQALTPEECVAMEPSLKPTQSSLAGGIFFPGEEAGDCHKFTTALAAAAAKLGVKFHYGTEIKRLEATGGRVTKAHTSRGPLQADNFVAALASFTPLTLRTVGIRIPIYPVKGVTITVSGLPWDERPKMPIVDDSRLFGLVPLGDRLRVSGSAEVAGYDTTPSQARCQAIINNVISVFPDFAKSYDPATAKFWAGVRPVTPTGTPILGRSPIPNLYVAAGHGHLGWTMGCGSGHVMADLVAGRRPAIDMSGFALADH